jgi:F-box interacting protein
MQLMDTEGTAVGVLEEPYVVWSFRASLGDLVCFSYGGGNAGIRVVDVATGKTLLACFESDAGRQRFYSCFGFGRAAQSGSLKVFRLFLRKLGEQVCEVLTLGEDASWRQTESPPAMVSLCYRCCSGFEINGALHFLSKQGRDDALSFDLDSEKWKVIHGPQGAVGAEEAVSIAKLNGTLCITRMVHSLVNIWLLGDSNKNTWIKRYTMDPFVGFVVPLRVLRSGQELLFYYYDYTSSPMLRAYDPLSGKCRGVETPTKLLGRIGLCSSNVDPRFCGLDVDTSDMSGDRGVGDGVRRGAFLLVGDRRLS